MENTPQIAPEDDNEIVPASMTNNAAKALQDALSDDERDWVVTVVASLKGRSGEAKKALIEALLDGRDVSALLGTSFSQSTETLGKSSQRRSSKRVCYDSLLRECSKGSRQKSRKTAKNLIQGCYRELLRELPQGVFLRGNQFYYRKTLPSDVQRLTSQREKWRSLRTDSQKTALRRLPLVISSIETEIEIVRRQAGLNFDPTLLRPLVDDPIKVSAVDCVSSRPSFDRCNVKTDTSISLGEAYDQYICDPTHAWSSRTRETYETSRRLAVSILGAETRIDEISRSHLRDYIDVLRFLPRNAAKRFPKLSAREAANRARTIKDIDAMSTANVNVCLANFSSFLNWAVNEELMIRNPARGLRLPDETAKRDKRFPFSPKQLEKIFHAPLYVGCLNGERGYATLGKERPRNARFWVPLIGLHTGMRLNEICQLDVSDVRPIDGVQCIIVTTQSLNGSSDKRLKTGASDRILPVHQNLIDMGIIAYAETQSLRGEKKLFGEIDLGRKGVRSVAFSKWSTQFLRKCGASEARTSFHSFRHNFRDELRAARIDHDLAMALGGWTSGMTNNVAASENYGRGPSAYLLNEAIGRLSFSAIDLSHLMIGS